VETLAVVKFLRFLVGAPALHLAAELQRKTRLITV